MIELYSRTWEPSSCRTSLAEFRAPLSRSLQPQPARNASFLTSHPLAFSSGILKSSTYLLLTCDSTRSCWSSQRALSLRPNQLGALAAATVGEPHALRGLPLESHCAHEIYPLQSQSKSFALAPIRQSPSAHLTSTTALSVKTTTSKPAHHGWLRACRPCEDERQRWQACGLLLRLRCR